MSIVPLPRRLQSSAPRSAQRVWAEQTRWISWYPTDGSDSNEGPQWKDGKEPNEQDAQALVGWYLNESLLPQSFPHDFTVKFFASGRFNSLFLIDMGPLGCDDLPRQLLLRIPMPWDPFFKTESEIATMMLANKAGIPTARVFFFDSSANNPLGLECIFMELLHGVSLEELGAGDPQGWGTKYLSVARQVNQHLCSLKDHGFDLIGSIYYDWDGTQNFFAGPIVHLDFAQVSQVVVADREPFACWQDYVVAWAGARRVRADVPGLDESARPSLSVAPSCTPPMQMTQLQTTPPSLVAIKEESPSPSRVSRSMTPVGTPATLDVHSQFLLFTMDLIPRLKGTMGQKPGPDGQLYTHLVHNKLHDRNVLIDPSTGSVLALLGWEAQAVLPPGFGPLAPLIAYRNSDLGGQRLPEKVAIPSVGSVPLRTLLHHARAGQTDFNPACMEFVEPLLAPPAEAVAPGSLACATVVQLAADIGHWDSEDRASVLDAVLWLDEE